jgi:DNA-directed RNA polymerase subunit RPC12/RpoP
MDFRFEHQCSQCGARLSLEESERLLQCRYCGVKSYLTSSGPFRFVLPHQAPAGEELIHLPYLRFRGNVFTCQGSRTGFRFVDLTQLAVPVRGLPGSLGFRPQAMTLKLLDPQGGGTFLEPVLKLTDILASVGQLEAQPDSEKVYHRAYIGERTSLVYLPLYRRQDRLVDAVTNRPLPALEAGQEIDLQPSGPPTDWQLNILPTICPVCGWQLEGEKDSVALACRNCERIFETSSGSFAPVRHVVAPDSDGTATWLPFWKISLTSESPQIRSFADFIRVTRQPRVPPAAWEELPMSVWCPAFRVRPKIFLHLLQMATMAQQALPSAGEPLGRKPLFPITLPSSEAAQTLKLALAGLTIKKSDLFPLLPATRFQVTGTTLVYLPFHDNGRELVQTGARIVIDKNTLDFGRKL